MLKCFAGLLTHGEGSMSRAIIIMVSRLGKRTLDESSGLQPEVNKESNKTECSLSLHVCCANPHLPK